ncbi:MAG: gamma-glutamyl-gamma-aminobutyrate hydrolase family protein, partial [Cyanobacteria bacterium]|nr:gamma-glutamyl-gamma-aminobutyrate hydrolase family protein [Cyanobacteriota bacterium]
IEHSKPKLRPVIGINTDKVGGNPAEYRIHALYLDAIKKAGGIPILIPPTNVQDLQTLLDRIDGVLMIGGADYPPTLYGEKAQPSVVVMDKERSAFDIMLAKEVLCKKGFPFLGICAGCQALNIASGGSLVQDIPTKYPDSKIKHASPEGWQKGFNKHSVSFVVNSKVRSIYGIDNQVVPTSHHQCVNRIGHHLRVAANSEDGCIESIETTDNRFLLGVQWHPERDFEHNRAIFDTFIESCRSYREKQAAETKH